MQKLYTIQNEYIKAEITSFGAELRSLKLGEKEYMWSGDAKYWGRISPILFPFVGKTNGMCYKICDKSYPMTAHGFARDMDFEICEQTADSIIFCLTSDAETESKYPFPFILYAGYRLKEKSIEVIWKVKNTGNDKIYFAIGGHPAFLCPNHDALKQSDYYIHFETDSDTMYLTPINENGLALNTKYELSIENGYLPVTDELFDNDALVIEGHQCHGVSLCTPDKKPYLTVKFDAPLFGVWSPIKKHAPFICIEPWYGRCDKEGYTGELCDREWENSLAAGETFAASYKICPM